MSHMQFVICGASVALSQANAALVSKQEIQPTCAKCAVELVSENEAVCGGALVGGRIEPDLHKAVRAIDAEMRRN
jgi:hypothetical protein